MSAKPHGLRKEHPIGIDVHKKAIPIAVLNSSGKLILESIIEAKASTIVV